MMFDQSLTAEQQRQQQEQQQRQATKASSKKGNKGQEVGRVDDSIRPGECWDAWCVCVHWVLWTVQHFPNF
jgi:hypothetical protein